jgi:hypothetical protein
VRATLEALVACTLCLLASAVPAHAEWHFTPLAGITVKGNTTINDPELATGESHPVFGGIVSLLGGGVIGAEGVFTLSPHFFQGSENRTTAEGLPLPDNIIDSSRVTALMANLMVTAPRRYTEYFLRPFVSGGFGLLRVSKRDAPAGGSAVFPLEANFAGFNLGGGVIGFFSQRTGVRFDFRYFSTMHATERDTGVTALGDPVHLRYMTASIGLVIRR